MTLKRPSRWVLAEKMSSSNCAAAAPTS
jgi:hypothetical protein